MNKMIAIALLNLLILTGCTSFSQEMNFEINKPINLTKSKQAVPIENSIDVSESNFIKNKNDTVIS